MNKHNSVDERVQSLLDDFEHAFWYVLLQAQLYFLRTLQSQLEVDGGKIRFTPRNMFILRRLPAVFQEAMNHYGLRQTISDFLSGFDGLTPLFESTLLPALHGKAELSTVDNSELDELKKSIGLAMEDAVTRVAGMAQQRVMFSVGGLTLSDMTEIMVTRFKLLPGEANVIAATGVSTYYRTLADLSFQAIEAGGYELLYTYRGPHDKLNRPFCDNLLAERDEGKTWTRKEIDEMDNGQLPDCFRTAGGWACRHQWTVAAIAKGKVA